MRKTIESKVADTILERKQTVQVGERTYEVAPPTIATIIEVSALIAQLPSVEMNPESILIESLVIAKDCKVFGDIVAVLILGANNTTTKKTRWNRVWPVRKYKNVVAELAEYILTNISPKQLNDIIGQILSGMEFSFFFSISGSLMEVNLIRSTREVVKTTASGQ